ncbi:MAG: hypothetical protein G3M70_06425 [Candidatus Nitronauta litoralis]|uniref:SGNH hydrolase-type esterase domain-containing protein n=1 Tax=Candidatus Nitronauta litoralis TaxID=2705533 RepID=A0A7T0BVG4_9BACT|nr:MAG: hypothetical protein G3M70_06425 [Candidatus Nitronauta litoralis]
MHTPIPKYRSLVFIGTTFIASLIILEGFSQLIFWTREPIKQAIGLPLLQGLDIYEQEDPANPGRLLLKPGLSLNLNQLIQSKKKNGYHITVKILNRLAKKYQLNENARMFQINRNGFKGPEIDRAHSKVRILSLGDSCTFGTLLDRMTYPRVIEQELNEMGPLVEVINAGLEGIAPHHLLPRLDEFRKLEPEIITLYIGWNSIFTGGGSGPQLATAWLLRNLTMQVQMAWLGPSAYAESLYNKPKIPDPDSSELKSYEDYVPGFIDDVRDIVEGLRDGNNKVVLITIPGLYQMQQAPSPAALQKGHLPEFTQNPYVLAKITERYNLGLKNLAREMDLKLVDLDLWSQTALVPRDSFFEDSIHLTAEGQEKTGQYLATQLAPLIKKEIRVVSR